MILPTKFNSIYICIKHSDDDDEQNENKNWCERMELHRHQRTRKQHLSAAWLWCPKHIWSMFHGHAMPEQKHTETIAIRVSGLFIWLTTQSGIAVHCSQFDTQNMLYSWARAHRCSCYILLLLLFVIRKRGIFHGKIHQKISISEWIRLMFMCS